LFILNQFTKDHLKEVQMLPVILHQPPTGELSYGDAISFLAANTVVFYGRLAYRPNGPFLPSYDINQVCCWLSEQPLKNGMRLCTINQNSSSQVALIEEPSADEPGAINVAQGQTKLNPGSLILISPDCHEALRKSIEYLKQPGRQQQLIKDPQTNTFSTNPLNYNNYVWPNIDYPPYNSQSCFVYTKKSALVQQLVYQEIEDDGSDDGDMEVEIIRPLEIGGQALKEFIFVEPNPDLPDHLLIMAENTIRLFGLNSRYYDYLNSLSVHCINYNASESETEYDDMRTEGRMQAYKRAAKSLHQLKTIRNLAAGAEVIQVFISQYKTLIELTGYTSVWATVFNDGNDPGGFNDIMGIPAPVTPLTPVPAGDKKIKRKWSDIVEITDDEKLNTIVEGTLPRAIKKRKLVDEKVVINRKRLRENRNAAAQNKDLWAEGPVEKRPKHTSIPGHAKNNLALAATLLDNVLTCRDEIKMECIEMFGQENAFCNFSQDLSVS
jgi:hypothetical protein